MLRIRIIFLLRRSSSLFFYLEYDKVSVFSEDEGKLFSFAKFLLDVGYNFAEESYRLFDSGFKSGKVGYKGKDSCFQNVSEKSIS